MPPKTNGSDKFALLGDAPVMEAERRDLLRYTPTATVLAGATVETAYPLTIGVFGQWGTGKTSLMRLIKDEVEKHEKPVAAVWFNAWQYEKEEHLIVPLVATINKELEKLAKPENQKSKWTEKLRKGAMRLRDVLSDVAYGFSFKGGVTIPFVANAEVNLSGKDMIDRDQDLTKDKETMLARSLYFGAFEQLGKCAKEGAGPRIVVFVDDLDRCFPDKAVELLEGIKLVLCQPGFSFVLGVNEAIIQEFIKKKYKKDFKIAGTLFEDYFDKIVQVRVPVPQRESGEMREYIGNLLDEGKVFPSDKKEDMIPFIAEACRLNPRSIVRLLNRIKVVSSIRTLEDPDNPCDPLALLVHIATDEARYSALRDNLDVTVTLEEERDGEKQQNTKTIGEYLSGQLEAYDASRHDLAGGLEKITVLGRKDLLEGAIAILKQNEHLCRLLKSETGGRWLREPKFRRMLGEASKSAEGEKKAETKGGAAPLSGHADPIRVLLSNMVKIPGGKFMMGNDDGEESEKPVHEVELDAFEIGAMPVTQSQYEAVMGKNPSHFQGPNNPVECVSWNDAVAFCEKLTEEHEKRTGETDRRFTLPTEAQWECACRAGSGTRFCFGDSEDDLDEYAWYGKNSDGATHPAGTKKPNAWGLYDMHGNVWEWSHDWYDEGYYAKSPKKNPTGPESGMYRVLRGGSWLDNAEFCRASVRVWYDASSTYDYFGFRIARVVRTP